jgi:hypothetical protein
MDAFDRKMELGAFGLVRIKLQSVSSHLLLNLDEAGYKMVGGIVHLLQGWSTWLAYQCVTGIGMVHKAIGMNLILSSPLRLPVRG